MNDEMMNNPLNLNNHPDDLSARENGKQAQHEAASSSSGQSTRRRKKDDASGRVYECRFCSLKFCKSQALGGHMNRHRPERETETLNKARMLVFSNENSISTVHGLPAHHLGGFHQPIVDPTIHFRPAYPVQPASTRLPTSLQASSDLIIQQNQPQPYVYRSSPRPHSVSSHRPSPYHHPSNDYYVGDIHGIAGPETTNYNCIGTPVAPSSLGSSNNGVRENRASMHATVSNGHHHSIIQDESWPCMKGLRGTSHQQLQPARLDLSLAINWFQERF